MKLTCPECASAIPAGNINMAKMLAVCPECSTLFPFGDDVTAAATAAAPALVKAKRRKVKQPDFVDVTHDDAGWRLTIRWHHSTEPRWLLLFMLGWLVLMAGIMLAGLTGGEAILAIIGLLATITPANYFGVVLLGRLTMTATADHRLVVHQGPLPWFGTYNTAATLEGVREVQYRVSEYSTGGGSPDDYYDVYLDYGGGSTKVILPYVPLNQAQYTVQELARYLAETADGGADALSRLAADDRAADDDDTDW
ncbi:MAG: hypothetical protein MUE40_17785, partial [Anaerolineae bacterium]|nr:hypothetical protein [Anaerolineae bacterium]